MYQSAYNPNPANLRPTSFMESQKNIDVSFSSNFKQLENHLPNYDDKTIEKIRTSFNAFLRVGMSRGRTLFCIGFLLVQGVIARSNTIPWESRQKFLLECFSQFVPFLKLDQSQRLQHSKYRDKLNRLFLKASQFRDAAGSSSNDSKECAKFIATECRDDQILSFAVLFLAKCAIGESMRKENLNSKCHTIFSKLVSHEGEIDYNYSEDFLKLFSNFFGYKLTIFYCDEAKVTEKVIGDGDNEVYILDYRSRSKEFLAILYKNELNYSLPNKALGVKQENILTRNIPDKGPNPVNQNDMKSSKTIISEVQQQNVCGECNICGQEILQALIFTNPDCGHSYCCYCLQDLVVTHEEFRHCYLRKCPKHISPFDVKQFLAQCSKQLALEKPARLPSLNGVPDEGPINEQPKNIDLSVTRNKSPEDGLSKMKESAKYAPQRKICNFCETEVNEGNPSILMSDKCQHSICKRWLTTSKHVYDGKCFINSCEKDMDFEKFQKDMQAIGIKSFSVVCSKCRTELDSNRIFLGKCGHRICLSCIEKMNEPFCPISSCHDLIDVEKLRAFREKSKIEEKKRRFISSSSLSFL